MVEKKVMIGGDEVEIPMKIDLIQLQIILKRDSDHVMNDGMYLVDENGML
jgi:hypothetical protein